MSMLIESFQGIMVYFLRVPKKYHKVPKITHKYIKKQCWCSVKAFRAYGILLVGAQKLPKSITKYQQIPNSTTTKTNKISTFSESFQGYTSWGRPKDMKKYQQMPNYLELPNIDVQWELSGHNGILLAGARFSFWGMAVLSAKQMKLVLASQSVQSLLMQHSSQQEKEE